MPSQELTNFVTEINQIMKKLFASAFIVRIAMSSCQSDVIDPADIDITSGFSASGHIVNKCMNFHLIRCKSHVFFFVEFTALPIDLPALA